jgi:hypothetical protein
MTDFVNLKIKSTQSFEDTHRERMYMHVFIGVSAVLKKKKKSSAGFAKRKKTKEKVSSAAVERA